MILALMVVAGMGPATADNPASGPTSSGQDLNVQITGPTGPLPVGTTHTTVNGVVSLGEAPTTEAHVSFVIDDSGSMTNSDFMKEKDGAYRMLTKLQAIPNLELYASLIFFETAVTVAVSDRPASSDTDKDGISDFKEALDARAHLARSTYTKDAVQAGIDQLSGKSGIKQIYLITDGIPSPSSQNPAPLAPALAAANIQVYSYAIGSQAMCSTLATISTKCTVVSTFDDLPSTITAQTVAGVSGVKVRVNDGTAFDATIGGLGNFSVHVNGLRAGANTVEATATASDGTTVTASTVVTVGEKPTVRITDGPGAGYQDNATAAWSFASLDTDLAADPYACKVDDGDYTTCASPYSVDLADGTHTFSVTATDRDGNVSEPATAEVRIDTIAPVVDITSGPQGTTTAADAHLTFTVTDANPQRTECSVDGAELQDCTSPVDLADLANGEHSLEVVATDAAGNTGRDTRSWTVDRRADNVITFAPLEDQVLPAGSAELDATSSSGEVQFSSLTPQVCGVSGARATLLATGTCTIAADSPQTDSHRAAAQVTRTFRITKAAQVITFDQPDDTTFDGADVPLVASSSSGLPVTVTSSTPAVCTVVAGEVHPTGAGTCTLVASQAGGTDHLPAAPVTRSLTVAKAPIVVTTSSSSTLWSFLTWRVTYTSVVKSAVTGRPVAGVPVTTRITNGGSSSGCTAITNANGVATCTSGPIQILLFTTYRATAAPTSNHLGGEATARTPLL